MHTKLALFLSWVSLKCGLDGFYLNSILKEMCITSYYIVHDGVCIKYPNIVLALAVRDKTGHHRVKKAPSPKILFYSV